MNSTFENKFLSFAFCTFNRAERLEKLIHLMRAQQSPCPFEILVINNNSQDNTLKILENLAALPGPSLRFVTETEQGIVAARNRALEEAMKSDILIFIDDDEIPLPGLVAEACHAIFHEGADCAGGKVQVDFSELQKPKWLTDDLLGFLAEVNHGNQAFWISDEKTPVWTANIAYNMNIFRSVPSLRFDKRYDRKGKAIGGGEDVAMFKMLLNKNYSIRYSPEMKVLHSVEPWRLHRRYFLKLHFLSGFKTALYEMPQYEKCVMGVPLFLFPQLARHFFYCLLLLCKRRSYMRQAMNVTHAAGLIFGCFSRGKTPKPIGVI